MKKTAQILCCLLFALMFIHPAGVLLCTCLGYDFRMTSLTAFTIGTAVLAVVTLIVGLACREELQRKTLRITVAVLPFVALSNTVCCLLIGQQPPLSVAAAFVPTLCACILAVRHGRPLALMIISLALSVWLLIPTCFLGFIAATFGNIGRNTVVRTVDSPGGIYYAQVIDSDQGALGGDTLVDVYEHKKLNAILFTIQKKPQRVYSGDWRAFENMQIYWRNDNCLVINGSENRIK